MDSLLTVNRQSFLRQVAGCQLHGEGRRVPWEFEFTCVLRCCVCEGEREKGARIMLTMVIYQGGSE